jgi:integrase
VSYTQQWRTTLEPLWGDREVASITASEISRFRAEREDSWVCGSRRGRKWKVRAGGCSAVCGCLVDTCAPDCGCTCGCRQMDAHSAGTPLIVLNHVFTYAMRHGWLESNPCQLAKARSWQPKTRDNVLPEGFGIETVTEADRPIATVAAAHLLCERIAYPYQLIPLLACYAALRTSEIAGLCRWSVDVPGSRLYVVGVSVRGEDGMEYRRRQKGTTVPGRVVKIPTELMTLLKAHLDEYVGPEPGAYLWPTTCKRPGYRFGRPRSISANTINQQFAKARAKAGLDPALDLRSLRKAGKGVVKDAVGKEWAATWAGHSVEVAEGHYDAKVTQLPAEVEAAVQRAQEAAWEGAA